MEKVMSRPASGDDKVLANARQAIATAQTLEQLRQAQAVVLPLVAKATTVMRGLPSTNSGARDSGTGIFTRFHTTRCTQKMIKLRPFVMLLRRI